MKFRMNDGSSGIIANSMVSDQGKLPENKEGKWERHAVTVPGKGPLSPSASGHIRLSANAIRFVKAAGDQARENRGSP